MPVTTPNMSLIKWTEGNDPYDHSQLASNFQKVDEHDHTIGKGHRLTGAALEDESLETAQYKNLSVTNAKLAGGITAEKLAPGVLSMLGQFMWWWRPNGLTPLPASGWMICAGQTISSSEHEFPGGGSITLPNLIGRTIFGMEVANIGISGGVASIFLGHSHSVNNHSHTVPPHSHPINLESGFNYATNLKISQNLEGNSWVHADNNSGVEHRHSINGEVGTQGPWETSGATPGTSEGLNTPVSIIPPYMGLLPLVRVKL